MVRGCVTAGCCIARGFGVIRRYVALGCVVAGCSTARRCGVAGCCTARGCGVAGCCTSRGCGVAGCCTAWGCGVIGCGTIWGCGVDGRYIVWGAIAKVSHNDGVLLLLGCGAAVSCGSARVLASHGCWVEVVVVMSVAVGEVAGVARSAGQGTQGSSCKAVSSLAPRAQSQRVTSGDPGASGGVIVHNCAAPRQLPHSKGCAPA